MAKTIAIVGAGRVGQSLGRALRRSGYRIGAVTARTLRSARRAARFVGQGKALTGLDARAANSDIVLLCTPDRQIREAARVLARRKRYWRGTVVLHTSGALKAAELAPLRRRGAVVASLHPVYPFPAPLREFPVDVVFGLEGDKEAVKEAEALVRALKGHPVKVRAQQKPLYHASLGLAAGPLLTLLELGARALVRTGLSRAQARQALLRLAQETLASYTERGGSAWVGPLERGDTSTVQEHLKALKPLPRHYQAVYRSLAQAALISFRSRSDPTTKALLKLLERRA